MEEMNRTRTLFSVRSGRSFRAMFRQEYSGGSMGIFSRASRNIRTTKIVVAILAVAIIGAWQQSVAQVSTPLDKLGTFKMLSVRLMEEKEYRLRAGDYFGATCSVRMRYEAPLDHGVYVYTRDNISPIGYNLKRTGSVVRWVVGIGGGDPSRSPGFDRIYKELDSGAGWIYLQARSAIEWEVISEPTAAGTEKAVSIFVRGSKVGDPVEVISPWFTTDAAK